jgi:hypothetical protein
MNDMLLHLHFSYFLGHLVDRFLAHDDGTLSLGTEDKFIGIGFDAPNLAARSLQSRCSSCTADLLW